MHLVRNTYQTQSTCQFHQWSSSESSCKELMPVVLHHLGIAFFWFMSSLLAIFLSSSQARPCNHWTQLSGCFIFLRIGVACRTTWYTCRTRSRHFPLGTFSRETFRAPGHTIVTKPDSKKQYQYVRKSALMTFKVLATFSSIHHAHRQRASAFVESCHTVWSRRAPFCEPEKGRVAVAELSGVTAASRRGVRQCGCTAGGDADWNCRSKSLRRGSRSRIKARRGYQYYHAKLI